MEDRPELIDIYQAHPDLREIGIRLQQSKDNADKINTEKQKKHSAPPADMFEQHQQDGNGRKRPRPYQAPCEHATIEKFYVHNTWQNTNMLLVCGKAAFEDQLIRILARKPDAISVILNNSSKLDVRSKPTHVLIKLNNTAQVEEPEKNETDANQFIHSLQDKLNGLEQQMKQAPRVVDANNVNETLNNLNFAHQLSELKHSHQIDMLKRDHKEEKNEIVRDYEGQLADKDAEIEQLNDYIDELEADAAETTSSLNGIEATIKKAENPSWITLAGKIFKTGAEELLKDNLGLVAKTFKVDEKELADYFLEKEEAEKLAKEKKSHNETSFEATDGINAVYDSLDDNKKPIADAFIKMCAVAEAEDLNALIQVVQYAVNDDGTINKAMLKKMYEAVKPA